MSSPLSIHVKRMGKILKRGAEDQIEEAGREFKAAQSLYDMFLSPLFKTQFDFAHAYKTAREMFGSSKVRFVAIDGSQDQRLMAGLAVFWGGAYASSGTIEFRPDHPPKVLYHTGFVERGSGVSSCVPIYVDRIQKMDQTVTAFTEPGQTTIKMPLTDQAVVDNSSIAGWIMAFSELYLAYKTVKEEDVGIILLDRSLSGTWTSLMYDTSKRANWKTDGALHGFEIDGVPIDVNEIGYGRYYLYNPLLQIPPARGDYLRYSVIYLLQNTGNSMTPRDICMKLNIKDEDRRERVEKYLEKAVEEDYLTESGGHYSIDPRYLEAWNRLKKLVVTIGEHIFKTDSGNPMQIKKGISSQWLTTQDLAFLCLYCLYMLIEECWNRNVLLIGITKDTTARDFKSHVIPICSNEGIWKIDKEQLNFPSTDRMLLQAVSLFNYDKITVPWSLIEYDAAFTTIVPEFEKHRKGYVSGAVKNHIIAERLFLKTYVQLEKSDRDPQLRSNVLFIDRLVYPDYDLSNLHCFKHEYGGAVEPIQPIFYRDNSAVNKVQNLVMITLKSMSARNIPDLFGHNKPLFIADKISKAQRFKIKGLIDTVSHLLMNNRKLRHSSFYMNTFRERRAEIEYTRRGS